MHPAVVWDALNFCEPETVVTARVLGAIDENAAKAISQFNGAELDGRELTVNAAKPQVRHGGLAAVSCLRSPPTPDPRDNPSLA